mgnify:CR=1 FL=1|jgi:ABC-type amino acid transport/signal transduction systems, periplasmic component/domain
MKHITLLAVAALSASGVIPAQSAFAQSATLDKIEASGTITIGYRESSIPFSYLDDTQQPIGFSIDLCARVFERIEAELGIDELKIEKIPVNSSNRIPIIQNGTVDLECGSTVNNAQRQEQVSFSVATFMTEPTWLVRSDSGFGGSADLAGQTVVVTQGSNAVGFAQSLNAEQGLNLNIIQARDHAESFLTLGTGRAVAFLEDDILLAGLRATSPEPEAFSLVPSGFASTPYALMFAKDDAEFKALVDDVLSGLMASGEFVEIYNKWFTQPIPPNGENLAFPIGDALQEKIDNPSDAID